MSSGMQTEKIVGLAALILLALGCALVLWPFLPALLWAAVICSSTWPIYTRLEGALGGRRTIAAALMTLAVAIILVAPFALVVATLGDSVSRLVTAATALIEHGPAPPPDWVAALPVVGQTVSTYWQSFVMNAPAFAIEINKLVGPATDMAMAGGAVLGVGLIELGFSVFISYFFYRHGRLMATYVRESVERIVGSRSRRLLVVVGKTVQGVVYGVIGTALAQALVAFLGFWIAGVPQAAFLGFLTFVLSFFPVGPPLVWGGAALWLFFEGEVWWSLFMAVWGLLLISSIDNLLRPFLLAQSKTLPILLGLFGFLGGILAFGFIGVFLGPTLLAVGYSLFREWHAAAVTSSGKAPPSDSGTE